MKIKGTAIALGFAILAGSQAMGQAPQSSSKTFNEFRSKILKDFSDYKSKILDHYADFLNGEWHEYEPIIDTNDQFKTPKPEKAPVADSKSAPTEESKIEAKVNPDALPGYKKAQIKSEQPSKPQTGGATPSLLSDQKPKSNYQMAAEGEPDPGFAFGTLPGQKALPDDDEIGFIDSDWDADSLTTDRSSVYRVYSSAKKTAKDKVKEAKRRWAWKFWERNKKKKNETLFTESHEVSQAPEETEQQTVVPILAENNANIPEQIAEQEEIPAEVIDEILSGHGQDFFFEFYGMPMYVPEIKFEIAKILKNYNETGNHYKSLDGQEGAKEAARQIFGLAQKMGLNGYLTFRLAEAYVNSKFPESNLLARTSATHFLMAQMGYDALMFFVNGDLATIQLPFDQTKVFQLGRTIRNGRTYHIVPPAGFSAKDFSGIRGYTYELPVAEGKTSDLRLTGLRLPYKPYRFDITGGQLNIKGEVNENLMKVIYRYPQMPMGDYATSWLDPYLREDIVNQIKEQLDGMNEKEAVQALLSFFHDKKGFPYATDQVAHGFEKPYFLEESLYYPTTDCEDRAIFFTYLVWNALNLPCELLGYEGHESAGVALPGQIPGVSYIYDGMKFMSTDPTYIGAPIGEVQPPYVGVNPEVDKIYK